LLSGALSGLPVSGWRRQREGILGRRPARVARHPGAPESGALHRTNGGLHTILEHIGT